MTFLPTSRARSATRLVVMVVTWFAAVTLGGGATHAAEPSQQQIRLPIFGSRPTPTPAQTPAPQRPAQTQRQGTGSQEDAQAAPQPAATPRVAAPAAATAEPTPSPSGTPSQAGLVAGSEVKYGGGLDRMTTGWLILAASGLVLSGVALTIIGQRRIAAGRTLLPRR